MFLVTVLHIILIAGLAFLLWRKQVPELQQVYWPALGVKLAAGLCLGLLYKYYFPAGDTFVYFEDASRVAGLARQDFIAYVELLLFHRHVDTLHLSFQEPRALFLTKVTSVVNLLTGDHYWLSGLYFSFISMVGALHLVKAILTYIPGVRWAALTAFLFFPSIVFWTSGLLKESIAMAALFFLTALFLKLWFEGKMDFWEYFAGAIAIIVLWNLKYYYVGVFVPVVVTSLLYRLLVRGKARLGNGPRVLIWLGIFLLPLVMVSFIHPNFNIDRILDVVVTNNAAYAGLSEPGEYIRFHDLRATPSSFLLNAPWALFSGLFRPLPWEAQTVVQWLAAVENMFLLVLFAAACVRVGRFPASSHRLLFVSMLVFVVLSCVFIAISAPNFGTLSRYRVGYLAFFVFLILCSNPINEYIERSFSRLGNR